MDKVGDVGVSTARRCYRGCGDMLPQKVLKTERPFLHFRAKWGPIRITLWAQVLGVVYRAKFSMVLYRNTKCHEIVMILIR